MQKGPRPLAASSSFSSSSCFLNMFLVPSSLTRSPCCQQESADYKLVQTIMFHVAATLQYPKKARGKVEMCCSIRRSSEVDKPLPEIKSGELSNFFGFSMVLLFFCLQQIISLGKLRLKNLMPRLAKRFSATKVRRVKENPPSRRPQRVADSVIIFATPVVRL
jgi:hypothetical protein